jgi:lipopolysaccharide export system permease protein
MPIVWQYLLGQYLKVFLLCLISFIAILLTTRLDEIAHFATLGSEGLLVLWFTLHQIPYLLPIAIPISSLISVIILVQRLSQTHEMTAFRACGLSLREVLTPILIAGFFISVANFYIVSELATKSHLATGLTKMELRSVNPLLLLHNKHLMRLKGIFSDTLGNSRLGEYAGDILIAMPNKHNSSVNLIIAKNLQADPSTFKGNDITLITPLNDNTLPRHGQMMIENMHRMQTSIKDFSQILQKKVWTLNNDHLRLALLRKRLLDLKKTMREIPRIQENISLLKQIKRNINRGYAELIRRFSISIAAFTFTLMGAAFGISISRNRSNRGIFYVVGLAALYIVAFFSAKGLEHQLIAAALLYIVPHLLIITISLFMLSRVSKGIES